MVVSLSQSHSDSEKQRKRQFAVEINSWLQSIGFTSDEAYALIGLHGPVMISNVQDMGFTDEVSFSLLSKFDPLKIAQLLELVHEILAWQSEDDVPPDEYSWIAARFFIKNVRDLLRGSQPRAAEFMRRMVDSDHLNGLDRSQSQATLDACMDILRSPVFAAIQPESMDQ